MFEFVNDLDHGEKEFIKEYNLETRKLILEDYDSKEQREISVFESGLYFNITDYENWRHNLYNALIRNDGKVTLSVLSTDKDHDDSDGWIVDIYRHKSLLPTHEYNDEIILISYVIVFADEVKGDILTIRKEVYSGCAKDEEEKFGEWLEEQLENESSSSESIFNIDECSLVISDGLMSEKEYKILLEDFYGE